MLPSPSLCWLFLTALALQVSASYFVISEPQTQTQWVNGAAHLVQWEKAVLDGIYGFDVEMARLTQDGLMLVAMNVPATQGKINLYLENVPPGDDYFLIFINSTHGVMHATSPRFQVLAAGSTPTSAPALTAAPSVPTVTVSGGPNPTAQFATTFAALPSGARRRTIDTALLASLSVSALGIVLGAGWTASW